MRSPEAGCAGGCSGRGGPGGRTSEPSSFLGKEGKNKTLPHHLLLPTPRRTTHSAGSAALHRRPGASCLHLSSSFSGNAFAVRSLISSGFLAPQPARPAAPGPCLSPGGRLEAAPRTGVHVGARARVRACVLPRAGRSQDSCKCRPGHCNSSAAPPACSGALQLGFLRTDISVKEKSEDPSAHSALTYATPPPLRLLWKFHRSGHPEF